MKILTGKKLIAVQSLFEQSQLFDTLTPGLKKYHVRASVYWFNNCGLPYSGVVEIDRVVEANSSAEAKRIVLFLVKVEKRAVETSFWRMPEVELIND